MTIIESQATPTPATIDPLATAHAHQHPRVPLGQNLPYPSLTPQPKIIEADKVDPKGGQETIGQSQEPKIETKPEAPNNVETGIQIENTTVDQEQELTQVKATPEEQKIEQVQTPEQTTEQVKPTQDSNQQAQLETPSTTQVPAVVSEAPKIETQEATTISPIEEQKGEIPVDSIDQMLKEAAMHITPTPLPQESTEAPKEVPELPKESQLELPKEESLTTTLPPPVDLPSSTTQAPQVEETITTQAPKVDEIPNNHVQSKEESLENFKMEEEKHHHDHLHSHHDHHGHEHGNEDKKEVKKCKNKLEIG